MADQRLTDKSTLTEAADSDFLEIIDVSDTSANAAGTTKKITKADLVGIPFGGSFLDLSDVEPSTMEGSEGKVPVVSLDEGTEPVTRTLRFERLPTFTDLYGGNAVITGGIIHRGALSFTVWATNFLIGGRYISTPVSEDVTQATADATFSRIDVFAIEIDSQEPPVASIVIIEGTPSASPVKPTVDLTNQVEVSFRTVAALETVPPEIFTETIYDESTGEPNEWDISNVPSGANISDNTDPKVGAVSITLPAYASDVIEWTKDSLYNFVSQESLSFYMRIIGGNTPKSNLQFKLIDSNTGYYYIFNSKITNLLDFGFSTYISDWQLVEIPLSRFIANSRVQTQFDKFEITFTDTSPLELDRIIFQGGFENPSNGLVVKFIDGVNPLDAVYTKGNVGVGLDNPPEKFTVEGSSIVRHTYDNEVESRIELGGENIGSNLGYPSSSVKGHVLSVSPANGTQEHTDGMIATIVQGDVSNIGQPDLVSQIGLQQGDNLRFANLIARINAVNEFYNIGLQVSNVSDDTRGWIRVHEKGEGVGYNQEPLIILKAESPGGFSEVTQSPHEFKIGNNIVNLPAYSDGSKIEGYINTDDIGATGTAATVLGAPTNSLNIDLNGNIVTTPKLLSEYTDNADAISGGLPLGAQYRTGDIVKVVH